jgi:hypothetical protein
MDNSNFEKIIDLAAKDTKKGSRVVAKFFYRVLRKKDFSENQIIDISTNILNCLVESLQGYEKKIENAHESMQASRRDCQRIPVKLEAELVYNKAICFALIENVSEDGIYAKITSMERIDNFKADKKVNLKFRLSSGQFLRLTCEEKWSKRNISNSMIEQIGLKIINPPQEYNYFYNAVKSGH